MERIRDYNRSPHGRALGNFGPVWEVIYRHRKCVKAALFKGACFPATISPASFTKSSLTFLSV